MKCPHCMTQNVIFDTQYQIYVCSYCGTVVEERPIYQGYEPLNREEENPRHSGSFTYRVHDHGIGSTEISGNIKKHVKEGRKWAVVNVDMRIDKERKKVVRALRELNELIRRIKPPRSVGETAGEILQRTIDKLNVKERTLKKIVSASLYLAYKECNLPRPVRVFAREIGISETDLWEGIRIITEVNGGIKPQPEAFEPRHYVNYITTGLNLPQEVSALASEILAELTETRLLSGRNPAGLAAAAVYLAGILMNHRKNQLDVGSIIGQTDVAVRNSYDILIRNLDIQVLL